MSVAEPVTREVPAWLAEMEFCHINDGSGVRAYCGNYDGENTCEDYDGEAVCSTCGLPTCPRCAQLSALEDELEEA